MATKRYFYEKYKEAINSVSGPMTKSSFQTTGKLTPQEFLESGDSLVQKFPAWEWASGDESVQPFLPKNKKYLILRQCPCRERAPTMKSFDEEADAGDDWVETHVGHTVKKVEVDVDGDEDDGWGGSDDDNDAKAPKQQGASEVRFYDVTVVYDQYYASPRVFLFGYDAQSQPLTKEEMMEDVYADNREKTVTVDPHPFLKAPCISIHPCRHAETMRRIIERFEIRMADEQEEAGVPESERVAFIFPTYLALFVFLKFIASVVPTISYDISVDLDM
jgi:ubiquitin-like-conjugating enzyme ATG3